MMSDKILFVDDEANILDALKRSMSKFFDLDTALGGQEGLTAIREKGPYAVIVSDLRMPGMDGIQFLTNVREQSADSVRVILSGQADLDAAMAAVNEGNIFRFLTKPINPGVLSKSIEACLEQYQLVTAEKELLEKTLSGSIKLLTEILALVNPTAFSKASRLKRYVHHIVEQLELQDIWKYELAAMLSQIGCVTLLPETLEKMYSGETLTEDEQESFDSHPAIGQQLLEKIPRLETIAEMIFRQQEPVGKDGSSELWGQGETVVGGQILKIALDFDQMVNQGIPAKSALVTMRRSPHVYDTKIVGTLENLDVGETEKKVIKVNLSGLRTYMILAQDVRTKTGLLLAGKGQEVTFTVLVRLRRFAKGVGVQEPITVLVPKYHKNDKDVEESTHEAMVQ